MATFLRGDCLEQIKLLPSASIDLCYINPPFGTTKQSWDCKLPWNQLFPELFRVLKTDGILAIHCSVPFNYELIRTAPKPPAFSYYWLKEGTTNPFIAKVQPLRNTEEILVWYNKKSRYYPQRVGTEKRQLTSNGGTDYYGMTRQQIKQDVVGYYQTHHLDFKRCATHGKNAKNGFGTRPPEMIELMIKSFTKENDVILDFTCHLGISGVIARRLNRRWIGIDKYFYPKLLME